MDKSLLIKVAVVGIILAFVIETFAFGMLGNPNANPTGNNNSGTDQAVYQGTAIVQARVVAYKPNLILQGSPQAVNAALKPMVASGVVIYAGTPDEQNRTLVNFAGDADMRQIAQNLTSQNITVYSTVVIALPSKFNITAPEGQKEVEGTTLEMAAPDIFGENDTFQLSVYIAERAGQILDIQNPVFLQQKTTISAVGTVSQILGATYIVNVPFGQRNFNRTMASELFGNAGYSIGVKQVSYISFSPPLSQEQLAKLTFPYVTYAQPSSVSILPSFTDGTQLVQDFALAGLNVAAPYSYIMVSANSSNLSAVGNDTAIIEQIARQVASESTVDTAYNVRLSLPSSVVSNGTTITGIPQYAQVTLAGSPVVGESVNVTISGSVSGTRLVSADRIVPN